jgi:transposase-like protein
VKRWDVDAGSPQVGRHFPRDLREFARWFDTEGAASEYLAAVRFRDGVTCPRCSIKITHPGGDRWWCGSCRRWFTVTTGTLLERTKVPLRTWLLVAWHLVQTKIGVSALSVEQIAGINYSTAWSLLHKMRVAMDQDGRDRLSGDVEFDETYVGGKEEGVFGRARGKKEPIAIACEHSSNATMGRIRMARLPDASALAIADFLEHNVEPGSVLLCDNWTSYQPAFDALAARGLHYTVKSTTLANTKAHLVHPHVHRVASLLKRWLLGTHQGSVQGPHLDAYLDEFVFRFNRRNARNRGLVFWRLVCALLETPPMTREEIGRRRADQKAADAVHGALVEEWRLEQNRVKLRKRYLAKAEEEGKTVRPYRRTKGL